MKSSKLQMTVLLSAALAIGQMASQAQTTINPAGNHAPIPSPIAEKADNPALMEPVKSVFDNYLKIQTALAKDSLEGVPEKATAMAKAIKGDEMKMLTPKIAT